MARRTWSGAQWSAWELDEPHSTPSIVLPCVQIVRARVSLAPYLRAAMDVAKQRANVSDTMNEGGDDEWEDKDPVLSHPVTPFSCPSTLLPPTSTSWSRLPSPLSDLPPSPPSTTCTSPTLQASLSPITRQKGRQAEGHRARRQRKRVAQAMIPRFGPVPQARHSQDYRQEDPHQAMCRAACDLPASAGGN